MREKFKKFRDGLSLEQVKKITVISVVIVEIIFVVWIALVEKDSYSRLLVGPTDEELELFITKTLLLILILILIGGSMYWMLYSKFGGSEKESKIENEKTAVRVKEKFKLQASEYTEIILTANSLGYGGEIKKMLLSNERAAGIKYFAKMSEDGEYFYIISKMGDKILMPENPYCNWRYLEANFEPKKTEDETTET